MLKYSLFVDLNAQDKAGNTPLHLAVMGSQTKVIDFLLENKINSSVLNDKYLAPIHLAVEENAVDALKVRLFIYNYIHSTLQSRPVE